MAGYSLGTVARRARMEGWMREGCGAEAHAADRAPAPPRAHLHAPPRPDVRSPACPPTPRYDRIPVTLRESFGLEKDIAHHLSRNYGTRALQVSGGVGGA